MKQLLVCLALLFFSACSEDKSVLLPEINGAAITEITDVSPAYIFYNETQKDSVELNRKSLIISTNWLVNIDRRLTLKQALPSIITLQEKKRGAGMHKNESAKNFFTCNDTSIKNLGFIDFTDVVYSRNNTPDTTEGRYAVTIFKVDSIAIHSVNHKIINLKSDDLLDSIQQLASSSSTLKHFTLNFNSKVTFQDYITIKSKLSNLKSDNLAISKNEFIFN
ncbi:hypothetical protein ES677_12725 [Bizionia gelidisalsuginis]|uniref:Lipoprotein n=2 Tax=Bizionia TaxID=283785 RepID=A0A8H2QN60_9FLAO|nr:MULTISPECIES: hypothetical protein [Bizionia]TYB80389.1 hypothetical protein ES676_01610 [Bizionia saleffrena]TYC09683.1 hypothetical protein ES677_12725 [Bizionia gelidisalsuginis]